MTYEEAIEVLDDMYFREIVVMGYEKQKAIDVAEEALHAMFDYEWLKRLSTPKRIKQEQHCNATYMICPHCHTSFGEKYKTKARNFCEDCGQRLDWSDDDERLDR